MTVTAQDGYRSAAAGGVHLGGTSLMRDEDGASTDPPATAQDLLARLRPRPWDSEASTAFEAAQEAINHAIGCYSSLLASEERSPNPRPDRARAWSAARQQCALERRRLRAYNRQQVAEVRARYTQLIAELDAELRVQSR
jgi:hypothetical protein